MRAPYCAPDCRRRVLAVDDEPAMAEWLKTVIETEGYDVRTALIATRAEQIFAEWHPDVVISDLALPDLDGIALLKRLKTLDPLAEVIVISGKGTLTRAVEAGQAGAFHFLEKPLALDPLIEIVHKAVEQAPELAVRRRREEGTHRVRPFGQVLGRSRKMADLFAVIESVAASDANILIQGESGTGKELIANAIHARSSRVGGPFIKINCAAIPRDLIESELFGYKKGAFTGATADKVGLFEMAEGGSLLLDEIGEMPPYLQTKLLRVLQERQCRPLGSDHVKRVDFRLMCATNVDLRTALGEGKLRQDLYFRINTITLTVPPLRERSEDIPPLCDLFLSRFNDRHRKTVRAIGPTALRLILRNRWAGNVRELENAIERAVLVCRSGVIEPDDLPQTIVQADVAPSEFTIPSRRTLAEIERMAILQTLQQTNWNKREAAEILGVYRPTLYSKMRRHEITDERAEARPTAPAIAG